MGTTLQNGVYLPNEGERNCYAGLKTNWEILDQKVADVTALQQAVAGALHRQIVTQLPTEDIDPNTIYMILSGTSATENVYDEYMYVNNAWELIGTSATDLTNYYTKAEVDGKLLLKASASDLTSHTGDTTIHVTTADKTRWNNNTYVFRYSSTALTPSSTNSNTLLDNTDNLKVGDKVIDSDGVLFSVTAIDTQNSTFTIGTALIDLALDANVVHTSGDETVGGNKTFTNNISLRSFSAEYGVTGGNIQISFSDKNNVLLSKIMQGCYLSGLSYMRFHIYGKNSNNQEVENSIDYAFWSNTSKAYFRSNIDNFIYLGTENNKWKGVYATNYYYGSNNVEFSTKFVTTDTNQTISGEKTFSSSLRISNSDTTVTTPDLNLKNYKVDRGTTDTGVQAIQFLDKNGKALTTIESRRTSNGSTGTNILTYNTDDSNNTVSGGVTIIKSKTSTNFAPNTDNAVTCGRALAKWSDVQTYKVNGLEPSSLSLPSDRSARIDISSYFTNTGTGQSNSYTVPANGYIYLTLSELTNVHCFSRSSDNVTNYAQTFTKLSNSTGALYILFPVRKNDVFVATWYTTTTVSVDGAFFIPCKGNV